MFNDKRKNSSKMIWVDFRKGKLSIDEDLYMERVSEVHCRQCKCRKPRKKVSELLHTWGYICHDCQKEVTSFNHSNAIIKARKKSPEKPSLTNDNLISLPHFFQQDS